ncbi:MAG: hypothetical protein ACI93E_001138 [Flavobacteriales bacterium]|jgi:hypothetical protein
MKLSFLSLLVAFASSVIAQDDIFENISFNPSAEDTCGAGNNILRPEHFIAYQTLDNTQDGEIDPTTCIQWIDGGLELSGADLTRPVFVRLVDIEFEIPYASYTMFSFGESWDLEGVPLIDFGNQDYCSNGLCCGMEIEIQIPSEDGVGFNTRIWQQEFALMPSTIDTGPLTIFAGIAMCIPTESFQPHTLADLVMKFMFEEGSETAILDLFKIGTRDEFSEVSNGSLDWWEGPVGFEFQDYTAEGSTDYIFFHDAGGYPSENNLSYIDFYPFENASTQQSIEVYFGELDTYTMHPFTFFRGELVEGEETLRHNLNVINEGATICFNGYFELIIQKGWSYEHRSGEFDFQGGRACMQLNGGSHMLISENGLRYGQVGQGMFALHGGSNILLEPNAHLYFDGKMLLVHHELDTEFVPAVMTLKEGAKLSFSEFAKLEDLSEGQTKLLVYNQGGTIDLTNLTAEERASIEIVNEEVETKHITLLGNPVAADGALNFLLFESGEALVRVLDANGKLMLETEMGADSPLIKLQLKGLPAGAYLLQVKQQAEIRTERFVIN